MKRTTCAWCGAPITQPIGRGRPRKWCGERCRDHAYRSSKRAAAEETARAARRGLAGALAALDLAACALADARAELALVAERLADDFSPESPESPGWNDRRASAIVHGEEIRPWKEPPK